jgi:hypothetical protein
MKTYNFLAINPYKYKIKDETDKPLVVELPDDMKLCMNKTYSNSNQQFWIFFYPYDEKLFTYINALTAHKGYGLNHTHAYKIGDYMVGNFSNVHFEGPVDSILTETLEELNTRFLSVFGNHLLKIEEENIEKRLIERELDEFIIFNAKEDDSDMSNWSEEKKRQYNDVMERYKKANETPFHTICIKRFLGFGKDEDLIIKTATVWWADQQYPEKDHSMITYDNDKWFMLMDAYNPSIRRRLTIEDNPDVWTELQKRQSEINNLLERR